MLLIYGYVTGTHSSRKIERATYDSLAWWKGGRHGVARRVAEGSVLLIPVYANVPRVGAGTSRVKLGGSGSPNARFGHSTHIRGNHMNNIIYIVGLVVIVLFILSYFGLR